MTPDQRDAWIRLLTGQRLDEYELKGYIDGGQFGLVFDAVDTGRSSSCALKLLIPGGDPDAVAEFDREVSLLEQLKKSSNVVDIFASGTASLPVTGPNGLEVSVLLPYYSMELADSCLEKLITQREQVDWHEKLLLWRGIILGIHQMHLKRIVHRDLKSTNCLLFIKPKNKTESKAADLGRSRDLKERSNIPPNAYVAGRGDLRFAPPEFLWLQGVNKSSTHRAADLYGLGSLLFELATGQGITQFTFGIGPELVEQNLQKYGVGTGFDLSTLRPSYSAAFSLFASSLPAQIAEPATNLLKQLCDPVPEMRVPRQKFGKGISQGDGLEWLIRRADILMKRSK